ncbi:unannotated protein [freshwater metagenome]|uniref:Unannotated protein n=1 Tax=freshwater metagenome TaxID=449393 RepID=A0A6J5YWS5_9ZZZZ|nr:hypothetical protein [Actinomycetota bacterium]
MSAARVANAAELFAEGPSRVVVCVEPESMGIVENLCAEAGVPVSRIGVAGGDRFSIKGLVDLPLSDVIDAWTNHIPAALGAGTAQD